MRNRVVWLMMALVVGFVGLAPGQAQNVPNLLTNGGFESGNIGPYGTYGTCTTEVVQKCVGATVPEDPVEGKYCLHVVVPAAGANNWDVGMTDGSHSFEQGKKYTFSAFMKTKSGTLQVRLKPERGADPWEAYNELVATVTDTWQEFSVTTPVIGTTVTPASPTFHFAFAPGDFWMDGIRLYEGDYVKPAFLKTFTADEPSPATDAVDVPQDVVLSWAPGPYAQTHNVYFGTTFDDVNDATVAGPLLASEGQAETAFAPASLLEFGKTYYWRVDEVNAAPDSTVFKGEVWSFTAEPYAYPITSITATASSSEKTTTGPANTINGSGLTNDLHSVNSTAMWASSMTGPQPAWIQYQFDKVYKLYELWVWNYNVEFEPVLGYGFKDVTIEYSVDGTNWTAMNDMQFAQATAQNGYAHNTTVDMGGVMAKYVRLTAKSNWSLVGLKQYGLSEVRFFHIPVLAREPQPADAAEGVALDAAVSWRPGREATSHQVYFSNDKKAVIDGTAPADTVTENSYQPAELEYGKLYYWRVDEVGATTYTGNVWRFSTTEFFGVDDFESYADDEGNRIYEIWIDGWTNGTGSTVGYISPPFAERTIIHSGDQSMPLEYNNVNAPFYSEAFREFSPVQNWMVSGVTDLVVWYRGSPIAFADKGDNAFSVSGGGTDIWNNADGFRFAYKSLNGNGSITAKVDSLTRSDAWSKAGVMIRETLDAGSKHAMCVITPDNGISFQRREATNGASTSADAAGFRTPYWVRITRTGNVFKAERSTDGKIWTQVGTDLTLAMSANVFIGMAVTSHNAAAISAAEFSSVATTGTVTGSWKVAAIGADAQPSNGRADMYVVVEDSAGKSVVVTNPDADAVLKTAWTEWRIPLDSLTGVNLAKVKTMYIGVGDRKNPQAGAAGKIFIDDIRVSGLLQKEAVNILANGGFEAGVLDPWSTYGNVTTQVVTALTGATVPENVIEGQYCLYLDVAPGIANFWEAGLQPSGEVFQKGKKYTISAFLKSKNGDLQVNFKPELGADPWTGYGEKMMTITETWAEYSVTTPVFADDVDPASFSFHIGSAVGGFWVDNVRFYEGDYVAP